MRREACVYIVDTSLLILQILPTTLGAPPGVGRKFLDTTTSDIHNGLHLRRGRRRFLVSFSCRFSG